MNNKLNKVVNLKVNYKVTTSAAAISESIIAYGANNWQINNRVEEKSS
ncbi:MAG: hypothetical protein LBV19_04900 [Streptococcaceae bacterium]|jgi:hypothetical protein|nr:hypothetical protein [Streptococcaceae bacterium]